MASYFKLPNCIFNLNLKSNELLLYVYLVSLTNNSASSSPLSYPHPYNPYILVKQSKIAQRLGYKSTSAIGKTIDSLSKKGLLSKKQTFYNGRKGINKYKVFTFDSKKDYFLVDRQFWRYLKFLSKSEAVIYLYLLKCKNEQNTAFPSISNIQKDLQMGRSTITTGIKKLEIIKLVRKKNYIKKDRSFGHNQFYIFSWPKIMVSIKRGLKQQKTRLLQRVFKDIQLANCFSRLHNTTQHLRCQIAKVKSFIFYFLRGSPENKALPTTHFILLQKE